MAINKLGTHTFRPQAPVYIRTWASVAGKKEAEGPLGHGFDIKSMDTSFGEKTWELAEKKMQQLALDKLLHKARLEPKDIDVVFSGDLLNQCIGSSFTLRNTGIPHLGLYGACSTMALSIINAALFIESGAGERAVAVTSSHFCSAERQYRFPLEYGAQRPPTSQWTVTGSGAAVITNESGLPYVHSACIGTVQDLGVKDANNMGAAMAPAAYDTISAYISDTKTAPSDYDAIITGDLGAGGGELLKKLFLRDGIDISPVYNDCGLLIFDREKQDVHAGGSGCGCGASVLCSYLLGRMKKGEIKNLLFCATGALLSPTSTQQGENIPAIAHLVNIRV